MFSNVTRTFTVEASGATRLQFREIEQLARMSRTAVKKRSTSASAVRKALGWRTTSISIDSALMLGKGIPPRNSIRTVSSAQRPAAGIANNIAANATVTLGLLTLLKTRLLG